MRQIIASVLVVAALAGLIILLSIHHQRMMAGGMVQSRSYILQRTAALPDSAAKVASCNIESLNQASYQGNPAIRRGATMAVGGWLVDTASRSVPGNTQLLLEHAGDKFTWAAPVSASIERPDVVAAQGGIASYRDAGFVTTFDTAPLPTGDYRLYLAYKMNEHVFSCSNFRGLHIDNG